MRGFLWGLIPVGTICLVMATISVLIALCDPNAKHYHVGDCFDIGEKVYQVSKIGRYSILAKTPHYEGFEEDLIDQNQLDKSVPVDCFDYFQVKDKQ